MSAAGAVQRARSAGPADRANLVAPARSSAPQPLARDAAWWAALCACCVAVHWWSFQAWFRGDDFAWMGLAPRIHSFRDLSGALFLPAAQGTFRPWSERVFFIAGFDLVGLHVLPFRIAIFLTQFANLALVLAIGKRLAGCRAAGLVAAILWMGNSALIEPLGWACVYNQVLCALFLLLAFYFLLRFLDTGDRRYEALQWAVFLLGFGAQELNLTYPALAAFYTWLVARKHLRRVLPMFAVSALYIWGHLRMAPLESSGEYAMHFTGSMLRTLGKYWLWTAGGPSLLPTWAMGLAVAILSLGLAWFARSQRAAVFSAVWYAVTLAPVLPLRDHAMGYYLFTPLIGICWMGGWAVVEAWRTGGRRRKIAAALVSLYALLALPRTVTGTARNYDLTIRVRNLVEGVARAHELHPGQSIVLDGIDTDLFWNGVLDHPFRAVGIPNVYLTPGSERLIQARPDQGDVGEFVLPAGVAEKGLRQGALVVYDSRGPILGDITKRYAARQEPAALPLRVDTGSPLTAYLLGPEWYGNDGGHRWMAKRATLRLGGPTAPEQKLYLSGWCREAAEVRVWADGFALGTEAVPPGDRRFELEFALPAGLTGKPAMAVAVEVSRTFRRPPDTRELGLAFGVFEVR